MNASPIRPVVIFLLLGLTPLAGAAAQDISAALSRQRESLAETEATLEHVEEVGRESLVRLEERARAWRKLGPEREEHYARARAILRVMARNHARAAVEAQRFAIEAEEARWEAFQAAVDLGVNAVETHLGGRLEDALRGRAVLRERLTRTAATTIQRAPDAATRRKFARILDAHERVLDRLFPALEALHAANAGNSALGLAEALAEGDAPRLVRLSTAAEDSLSTVYEGLRALQDYLDLIAPHASDPRLRAFVNGFEGCMEEIGALALVPFTERYLSASVAFGERWMDVERFYEGAATGSPQAQRPRPRRSQGDRALDSLRAMVERHGDRRRKQREEEELLVNLRAELNAIASERTSIRRRIAEIDRRLAELGD